MKAVLALSGLAALAAASPTRAVQELPKRADGLPAVTVSGNAFFTGKNRWYMRGIDYQPGGSAANIDPLADPDTCKRDIKNFKELGVNTIRVYAVDNSKDHDECMKALDDAGIYLVLDVNNPQYSLHRTKPGPSYNADYLQSVFATVEMFAKYDNVAAFFSGNEVINDEKGSDKSAPYVKAVTRDMKNYMNTRGLRKVPVGYSAADVSINRMEQAMYFNCGSDDMRSDFFAFNDYSWCNSNFKTSGWDQKVKNFTDYGLPIFLSEYGCIENRPREFEELSALMSDQMSAVYSGGLMYEYSVEENDYGIVTISKGGDIEKSKEFNMFKEALEKYPMPTGTGGAAKETHSVDCPDKASNWEVEPEGIPSMPEEAEKYMKDGAGDGPGLEGPGSQQASDSGTSTADVTSGQPSPTGTSDASNEDDDSAASPMGKAPLIVTGATLAFSLVGTLLL